MMHFLSQISDHNMSSHLISKEHKTAVFIVQIISSQLTITIAMHVFAATRRINITAAVIIAVISSLSLDASAFTTTSHHHHQSPQASRVSTTFLYSSINEEEQQQQQLSSSSRRSILSKILLTAAASTTLLPTQSARAATSPTTAALITDLQTSLTKISALPTQLEQSNWDAARTILKTPPVNQLWNLGESSNTIVKLAKETGEFELLELKDDLAISLQMCDQYSYDNVFIYYQPEHFVRAL
eukprot:scaffold33580_cov126-Skeletonema_menzelii.AAC.1